MLQTLFEVGATSADGILGLVDAIVKSGLVDTAEEVVVLNLQMLAKVAQKASVQVITKLEELIQIFEKKLIANYKLVASQQSQERALNIIRAILKVIYLLESSNAMQENPMPVFQDFVQKQVLANATARDQYDKIKEASIREF